MHRKLRDGEVVSVLSVINKNKQEKISENTDTLSYSQAFASQRLKSWTFTRDLVSSKRRNDHRDSVTYDQVPSKQY